MPCPHNEITIVQRSQRQSAVAAAAYQSGEKLFCEYDQQVKHYPEKRGIVHNEILLPANAPQEYADRNTLWNAAEAMEKQWNSQLARRWVLTIPREIPPDQYAVLVREFCEQQFVSKGMIADFAIHVPLPLPELWEAVKWAVKPDGAVLFFAQCPYDKVLGASNLSMLRYEWVWYKSRCTGFLNARRAPLKRTENILVFYQKLPYYDPQFEQGKPYKKISRTGDNSPNYGKFLRSSSGSEDGLRFPGNLLAFSSVQRTVHPTQKPVELCEYLIRTYTRPGEVVADICAGSGTTAVAAVNTGRRFVCFETAPAFYAPATERIRLATEAVKAGQKGV